MLSDQDLIHILSQSKDATAVYDSPYLHIRFVNDAMLRIWGKEKDVTGKTFDEALPETGNQPFSGLLKQVWQSGQAYTATDTPATLHVDGQLKTSFFDFEYRPLKDALGTVYAILHTAIDVNSRVAANRELQASNEILSKLNFRLSESETDFRRLVEQAPAAILVFRGPELMIDLVNQPMLEILGKDMSIAGQTLLGGMPELKGEPAVDLLFDVYRLGKSFDGKDVPVRMLTNGKMETRYFDFSYRPLRDQGEIIGVMDLAVEVTEQVHARQRLEAIVTEKSVILDTMAEGVIIVNTEGQPTYANAMAQRIMGYNEEQIKERGYNDAKWKNERIDGSPLQMEDHPMYVVLQTGLPVYDQEIAVRIPDRDLIYISINAAPLISDEQKVIGVVVTFTDVTNRRMILQQKEDFISVASHELKTPVTALKASLQLLDRMQGNIKPEMLSKLVVQANKSLNKLSDLVNSLLNSNRISQGRFPIHKTNFSIAELINDCCQHIRTAGIHEIVLQGDIELQVSADEQLLDQVMVNLLNNAVKYAPKSKQIIIEVKKAGDRGKVSVSDTGPGIPPEKAQYIFERYYQGESGGRQFSGLGLGLYICAEIIHKHGGEIGVDSEQGQGSTFWFTLPLAADTKG